LSYSQQNHPEAHSVLQSLSSNYPITGGYKKKTSKKTLKKKVGGKKKTSKKTLKKKVGGKKKTLKKKK